jgi:hypothetical protein
VRKAHEKARHCIILIWFYKKSIEIVLQFMKRIIIGILYIYMKRKVAALTVVPAIIYCVHKADRNSSLQSIPNL